jgi:hypothetical protein
LKSFKSSSDAENYFKRREEILKTKLLLAVNSAMIEMHYFDKDKSQLNLFREKIKKYGSKLKDLSAQ